MNRRDFLVAILASTAPAVWASAATREIWSADEAFNALTKNTISMIDVRSRQEWLETGIAKGAWPISMHEGEFQRRLFAAHELSGQKSVALICATGGRSASLLNALKRARFTGFIDVSECMLGSHRGPGWIARGLPIVELKIALANLPQELR